jgi:LDH2 family malate/lactate/ureidoglycolate dehydrogenase
MAGEQERRLEASALRNWAVALLEAAGLATEAARTVAASLVEANLRGVDSHGVARLPVYVERLRAGLVNGTPRPRVLREEGALALVDGDLGPGQVAGVFAAELAVALARRHGLGAVAVRRSSHYGAAAYYVMPAAREGLVALTTTNSEPYVVPFGGRLFGLGTNPIALAAPTPDGVFVVDMATSQVAANRVFNARDEGRPIPEGWAVDESGASTTDPNEAYAVLPLGGYKGYALAVMVEVLSGVLPGAGIAHGVGRIYDEWDRPQDVGHFHLALDPERTVGRVQFAERLHGLLAELRAIPPAPGHGEVLVPGEPEERAQREREAAGIPLGPALWEPLDRLSRELAVEVPA